MPLAWPLALLARWLLQALLLSDIPSCPLLPDEWGGDSQLPLVLLLSVAVQGGEGLSGWQGQAA